MQRLKYRQKGCCSRGAGIRREVEQHDGNFAVGPFGLAQLDQAINAPCQHLGPLGTRVHVAFAALRRKGAGVLAAGASPAIGIRPPAKHHRPGGTVEFGNGDHNGRFDRHQTAIRRAPLFKCLEFKRLSGNVRDIEARQRFFGRLGVVIGWAANERKPGQRDQRIDGADAVFSEELFNRGP